MNLITRSISTNNILRRNEIVVTSRDGYVYTGTVSTFDLF